MPTGSLAPDSPSSSVPLRPSTSRSPRTEKTTAGSVGATAVATRQATYQSRPTAKCASSATPSTVRKVPTTPTRAMGRTAVRKVGQPMLMPPSNRISISAMLTTSSTAVAGGRCRPGTTAATTAAAASISPGAGIRSVRVSRLDTSATRITPADATAVAAKA